MTMPQDRAALIARLLAAWERAPEKRLGELIVAGLEDTDGRSDVYGADDIALVEGVEALVQELVEAEAAPEGSEDRRPVVRISPRASVNVDAAIVALRGGKSLRHWVVYMRNGDLVQDIGGETRRFPPAMVPDMLSRVARWQRQNRRGDWVPAHPPAVALAVIRRADEWAPSKEPTVAR